MNSLNWPKTGAHQLIFHDGQCFRTPTIMSRVKNSDTRRLAQWLAHENQNKQIIMTDSAREMALLMIKLIEQ